MTPEPTYEALAQKVKVLEAEKNRLERELSHMHDLMHYVVWQANSAMAIHDRDMKYLYVSENYLKQYKVKERNVIGRHHYDVFPDLPQKWRDVHQRVLAGAVEGKDEDIYVRADGSVDWTRWTCRPWYESDGSIGGIIVDTEVITDRKLAEQALLESEFRHKAMLKAIPDMMFRMNSQGVFLDYKADESDLYVQSCSLVGRRNRDMTPPEFADLIDRQIRVALETGALQTFEYQLPIPGKGLCDYEARMVAVSADEVVAIVRDITMRRRAEAERKTLEERLQRSEKMEALGTLAGGVAHDLNNVLGIIVGYSEMLLEEIDASNPARNDLLKIMEGGNRSAAIVQDLLTLARRGVQTRTVFNLNNIVMDCTGTPEFQKLSSLNPQVTLQMDLEADLLNIMGSPVHLGKSIMNLVSNAIDAMPGGGTLRIGTRNQYLDRPIQGYDAIREGDYVVLTVSDTGEGISARDIKHIFEPFYTKKIMGKSGTGLGLAVVWGTVKDHYGYIDVQSSEGKGTTFTIYFPVTRKDTLHEQINIPESEYRGQGEAILVVDDVEGQRELASRMLTRLNYQVTAVASGEEAVEYLQTNKADLIVLDMIMDPGIDGLETYVRILEINKPQRAVIVSGFSESERVKRAQELGAGTYVKKPYVLERLGLAVRRELDREP